MFNLVVGRLIRTLQGYPLLVPKAIHSGYLFEVVIDDQRSMVGKALGLVNTGLDRRRRNTWSSDLIIDAPPDVLGPGLAAIAPPGVGLFGGIRIEVAIDIDPAQFVEDLAQPGPLLGQETRVLLVRLPVLQVDFLVGDIPVATEHDFPPFGAQRLHLREKHVEKAEFGLLTLR